MMAVFLTSDEHIDLSHVHMVYLRLLIPKSLFGGETLSTTTEIAIVFVHVDALGEQLAMLRRQQMYVDLRPLLVYTMPRSSSYPKCMQATGA
jgi:hypothetical protein